MRTHTYMRVAVVTLALATFAAPLGAAQWQRGRSDRDWQYSNREAFERGYREGVQHGEDDARRNRSFSIERDRVYRDGDRGYNSRYGSRDAYRDQFRRGFSDGYRDGYSRFRGGVNARNDRNDRFGRRTAGGYQEPAFARGYSDGFEKGRDDGDDRDRYDPARHGDYRDADNGYDDDYGSKDAYRNNYRTGFRQGYEAGYRGGVRRR